MFYQRIHGPVLSLIMVLSLSMGTLAMAQEPSVEKDIRQPVRKSIETRQETQKNLDAWEQQRLKLVAQYEKLKSENQELLSRLDLLKKQVSDEKKAISELHKTRIEMDRISKEIEPFFDQVVVHLDRLIENDPPFLSVERKERLAHLKTDLSNPDISISEKFRKVMEVLFKEAELGNTIEVVQDKVDVNGTRMLVNVFRLGRISLIFQTLDHKLSGYYKVSDKTWQSLPPHYNHEIQTAIEMASKKRPVDLLCLPLGKLAAAP